MILQIKFADFDQKIMAVQAPKKNNQKQAGAELGQAQVKLEVIVYIGVKVEVEKNLNRSRDQRIGT